MHVKRKASCFRIKCLCQDMQNSEAMFLPQTSLLTHKPVVQFAAVLDVCFTSEHIVSFSAELEKTVRGMDR